MTHALHIMQKQINAERSSNHLPNSACPYQSPPHPPLWALYQTFQRSFGKHSMWHATLAVPGRNVKRASSQKNAVAFTCQGQPRAGEGPDPQPPTLLCKDKQTRERKREIDGGAWRQRKTEGLDRSGAEIKSQADLQPVCLLLLLLLLAPSYQPAEGSAPPPPPTAALVSSTSSPPDSPVSDVSRVPECAQTCALSRAEGSLATGSASLK